mmetsp:Transcript_32673/g.96309  ORF Transcript_32673/g.96309 Transcript_32673/m.96309 type:complete len:488 (-) Transcript_32673:1799-3262(-)
MALPQRRRSVKDDDPRSAAAGPSGLVVSTPIVILLIIAALDSADRSLLSSSFPILERTLGFDVQMLGYFSLSSNLSYAASMPLWGYLVHRHPHRMQSILAAACVTWGLALVAMATDQVAGPSIVAQACLRAVSGAALASILPLSQALLAELVPPHRRGSAFGMLQVCEKIAGTVAASSVIYFADQWRTSYRVLGLFSVGMGVVTIEWLKVPPGDGGGKHSSVADTGIRETNKMTFLQIVRRVAKIPALGCLIGQGLFGGIPWDCMSFVLLLMDWKGYTKEQIVLLQLCKGGSGMIGGYVGGYLGDHFAARFSRKGRVYVAILSKVGGTIFYAMFLFSASFHWTLIWLMLFMIWGSWPVASTIRPIMSELAQSPSERAQIVAVWILLEKTTSSLLGSPLVGYMTSDMISGDAGGTNEQEEDSADATSSSSSSYKADALAYNLFRISTCSWAICICFWILMIYTLRPPSKKGKGRLKPDKETWWTDESP